MAPVKILIDYLLLLFSFLFIAPAIAIVLLYNRIFRPQPGMPAEKRLLNIWTSHSYNSIKMHGHEQLIIQQNAGNFFCHVYTVYPLLGAHPLDRNDPFKGRIRSFSLAQGHTFIEANIGFFSLLSSFPRTNFLWSQACLLVYMYRLIRKEQITMLRAGEPFLTGLYCYILSRATARPFVLRIGGNYDLLHKHGTMVSQKIFKWYFVEKMIARFVFPRTDLVMAVNQNNLDYCLQNGARKNRSIVTRYGNLIDQIHAVEPTQRPPFTEPFPFLTRPFGVHVGRLTKLKHVEDLLLVVQEAKKSIGDIAVVLIGDGDLTEPLQRQAADLGIADDIFFLGHKNQEWVCRFLPLAAAYLSPLTGRALVEAAFAGLPLIAYDWEWHSEMVIPGETGELIPYRDWKKMAEALVHLVRDKEYARKLGTNARKLALEMMDQQKIQEFEKTKIEEVHNKYFKRVKDLY